MVCAEWCRKTYLLGDLTSSTRLSKACLAGVAVDTDEVWPMESTFCYTL